MLRLDLMMSDPDRHGVTRNDFGATLDLGAVEKGNRSVDNHAVMCIFFVVSDWRVVEFNDIQGKREKTITSDCDKWTFFGNTTSKGGK